VQISFYVSCLVFIAVLNLGIHIFLLISEKKFSHCLFKYCLSHTLFSVLRNSKSMWWEFPILCFQYLIWKSIPLCISFPVYLVFPHSVYVCVHSFCIFCVLCSCFQLILNFKIRFLNSILQFYSVLPGGLILLFCFLCFSSVSCFCAHGNLLFVISCWLVSICRNPNGVGLNMCINLE
jgi:hypothetical protein